MAFTAVTLTNVFNSRPFNLHQTISLQTWLFSTLFNLVFILWGMIDRNKEEG